MTDSPEKIWYAVIQNKADGPHSKAEIQTMLDSGKLSYADFLFKPGLAQWTPVAEFGEFERRDTVAASSKADVKHEIPADNGPEGWILLVRHSAEGGKENLVQSGPYSTDQVRDKLEKKEIQYSDHIWQRGFKEWTRIGALDGFERRRPRNFEKQPNPKLSQEKSSDITIAEASPQVSTDAPVPKKMGVDEISDERVMINPKSRGKRLAIAGIGSVLGMFVAYFGLQAYKQTLQPSSAKVVEGRGTASLAPASSPAAPRAVTPQLKIVALKTNTPAKPQLAFETNLPAGTSILIEVSSAFGAILNYPKLQFKKEIRVVTGQMPILDLSSEDLPYGDYNVTAQGGSLSSQTVLKVGVHDEVLKKKLAEHKGQLIVQEKKERVALLTGAKVLAQSNDSLLRSYSKLSHNKNDKTKKLWGQAMASWKKDFNKKTASMGWIEKQNPKTLVYPVAQVKLTQAKNKLVEVSRSYNAKINASRNVASQSSTAVDEYRKAIQDLQGELKNLNLQLKK